MEKKIFIGGRIESAEVGGVVTGAKDILDDTKQKKQNVINKETDDELERLDNAKQNNLTFDNAPTENSTNPVTSGGVYTADKALSDAIEAILLLIPSAATALNQLADKAFVNSTEATNTATFRGTSATGLTEQQFIDWADSLTHDKNDYVFWQTIDAAGNTLFKRYKYDGTQWLYEYTLNNSSFTADQWAAISSGITAALVTKLSDLPTAAQLDVLFAQKQNTLTFDDTPTLNSNNPVKSNGINGAILSEKERAQGAESDLSNGIGAIDDKIPSEASTSNKLADKAWTLLKILANVAKYKGTYATKAALDEVTGNDYSYGFVTRTDGNGNSVLDHYTYDATNGWVFDYTVNNNSFTQAEWNAIQSGITTALVQKLSDLPTAVQLIQSFDSKQDVLTFDNAPTLGSNNPVKSTGIKTAINDAVSPLATQASLNAATARISTNEDDIAALQAAYAALTQSEPVVVAPTDTWPVANPQQNVIYRVVDRVNTPPEYYQDYMWNGTAFVLMAQYNNAIDDVPTAGSNNLVKSGGVYDVSIQLGLRWLKSPNKKDLSAFKLDCVSAIIAKSLLPKGLYFSCFNGRISDNDISIILKLDNAIVSSAYKANIDFTSNTPIKFELTGNYDIVMYVIPNKVRTDATNFIDISNKNIIK